MLAIVANFISSLCIYLSSLLNSFKIFLINTKIKTGFSYECKSNAILNKNLGHIFNYSLYLFNIRLSCFNHWLS